MEKEKNLCSREKAKELARESFIKGEKNGMEKVRAIFNRFPLPYFNWAEFERGLDKFLDEDLL